MLSSCFHQSWYWYSHQSSNLGYFETCSAGPAHIWMATIAETASNRIMLNTIYKMMNFHRPFGVIFTRIKRTCTVFLWSPRDMGQIWMAMIKLKLHQTSLNSVYIMMNFHRLFGFIYKDQKDAYFLWSPKDMGQIWTLFFLRTWRSLLGCGRLIPLKSGDRMWDPPAIPSTFIWYTWPLILVAGTRSSALVKGPEAFKLWNCRQNSQI